MHKKFQTLIFRNQLKLLIAYHFSWQCLYSTPIRALILDKQVDETSKFIKGICQSFSTSKHVHVKFYIITAHKGSRIAVVQHPSDSTYWFYWEGKEQELL